MHLLIKSLAKQLELVANNARAKGAQAYMKNPFKFLGIPTPRAKKNLQNLEKNKVLADIELDEVVRDLWGMEQREYQYCAIELMADYHSRWNKAIISLFEYCITHKSWWDTVDFLAT